MTTNTRDHTRDDDPEQPSLENIAILPNLVEDSKDGERKFDIDLFSVVDLKIRILIVSFAAIGAYFIVYNTYLQCPREDDALSECANLFVYTGSLASVVMESALSFNAKQLLIQLRFEDTTVFNYWTAGTIIVASLFLLVYMHFANRTFSNFRSALRDMSKKSVLREFYAEVASDDFNQAIGATRNALVTRRETVYSVVFCLVAIGSAISFWIAVVFVIASIRLYFSSSGS
jgi:hypothetical protein